MSAPAAGRWVTALDHPHDWADRDLVRILGGKGLGLAEMTGLLGLPVPPGFTISTAACRAYLAGDWPDGLDDEIAAALARLEEATGRRFGDPDDPLLVSVRSGAPVSMPGMLDTILDVGLDEATVAGLAAVSGDARFAHDSHRRLVTMYATTVLGLPREPFEELLGAALAAAGVAREHDLPARSQERLVAALLEHVDGTVAGPFPRSAPAQLRGAVEAVFRSWGSRRAVTYRAREGIGEELGTAVTVQAMVFGNRNDRSGTGVVFSRNPISGAAELFGDFLVNAQGEDVVAGIRTPEPIAAMRERFPAAFAELTRAVAVLERRTRDLVDVEFTIEDGRLWLLQTRRGKRSARAALHVAAELAGAAGAGPWISRLEAVVRLAALDLDDPSLVAGTTAAGAEVLATGTPASPGVAAGRAYFTSDAALDAADRGERVVLVRTETSPDDIPGMDVAEGFLTAVGGLVSHAAIVARAWGKPAVVGTPGLEVHDDHCVLGGRRLDEGAELTIDGTTGEVLLGAVDEQVAPAPAGDGDDPRARILAWADELRGDVPRIVAGDAAGAAAVAVVVAGDAAQLRARCWAAVAADPAAPLRVAADGTEGPDWFEAVVELGVDEVVAPPAALDAVRLRLGAATVRHAARAGGS